MLAFLFYAFVAVLAAAVVWAIITYLPDPPVTAPFKNVLRVLVLFALLVFLLAWLFGWAPGAPWTATGPLRVPCR